MTLGMRIKKVRKELDLTQQKFAEHLGVKQNTIALIESGKRNTSDQLLFGVCREFNVSEKWLRTGEGEMFIQRTRYDELTAFMDELLAEESPDFRLRLVTALSRLNLEQWKVLESVALELMKDPTAPVPAHTPAIAEEARAEAAKPAKPGEHSLTIDEQVKLYRQQLISEEERAKQASSAKESGAG